MKRIVVFDLDMTVIDSNHRVPNHPDGTLNLEKYVELKTNENVMRDTLLPLADFMKKLDRAENYVIICTARCMTEVDLRYLELNGLTANKILCRPVDNSENHIADGVLKRRKLQKFRNLRQFRKLQMIMFDDSPPVISEMRKMGIICMNALKVNKRLAEI